MNFIFCKLKKNWKNVNFIFCNRKQQPRITAPLSMPIFAPVQMVTEKIFRARRDSFWYLWIIWELCTDFAEWPYLDGNVTCQGCKALVLTSPHTNCIDYCESFDHICVAAEQDESGACAATENYYACNTDFQFTSNMLCTCEYPPGNSAFKSTSR